MANMQINIVVETSLLLSECLDPSLDADNPTLISDKYVYIVITQSKKKIVGLKNAKLTFAKASIDRLIFN
ncbi:MAG: hypothetical protein EOO44_18330, partial [Flavobacterium sp.]